MTAYRLKLIQAGTKHYIDGLLTYAEAERRLDIEEAVARATGWRVDHRPGQLVLERQGVQRIVQLEIVEPEGQ